MGHIEVFKATGMEGALGHPGYLKDGKRRRTDWQKKLRGSGQGVEHGVSKSKWKCFEKARLINCDTYSSQAPSEEDRIHIGFGHVEIPADMKRSFEDFSLSRVMETKSWSCAL